jgi:hypothetical protein
MDNGLRPARSAAVHLADICRYNLSAHRFDSARRTRLASTEVHGAQAVAEAQIGGQSKSVGSKPFCLIGVASLGCLALVSREEDADEHQDHR